ncbi:hypothetical protein HHK36_026123 [Tetracentron sinense]|uniref:Uncharacterized protein n=1 Tax=Tetracentron sinense TaxID=13715 RepID=A0A835D3T4_TETSI|nr:hypothetical protein HHK36_026123 [Tetracentron sinense]
MVADKGKKSKVAEEESEHIDGELVFSIKKLQEIQDELEKVNEEASDKVLEVEQKLEDLQVPNSLDVEDFKDVKSGYSFMFNFNPNPYFEDTKLMKTFSFFDEGTTKITGTTIKWKEGMDTTNGVNHEKKGSKRPLTDESFFSWFSETQQKDVTEGIHDEVAEIIKEDL